MTETETVGFIGVGAMGSAIASRLVAQYDLRVTDLNPSAADDLVAAGATFSTLEDIARECSVIFVCVPGPANVTGLLLGPDGLGAKLQPGAVVIDITSSTPATDQEVRKYLGPRGVAFVDSPIAGGVRRAREGTSVLMVGAADEDFVRVEPYLRSVTSNVVHVGPGGAGHAMKLVNNLLNSINRFAALETVRLGQACGIEQDKVIEVLNASTGRNYTTEYTFPQLLSGDGYRPQGFTLALMLKDVHLANDLADGLGHATPLGHLVEEFTQQAIERFGGDADQSQMMAEWYPAVSA